MTEVHVLRATVAFIVTIAGLFMSDMASAWSERCVTRPSAFATFGSGEFGRANRPVCFTAIRRNVMGQSGQWLMLPPMKRIDLRATESASLDARIGHMTINCRSRFQDVAEVLFPGHEVSSVISVAAYVNCPIPLPAKLQPVKLRLRESITISIAEIRSGYLIPTKGKDGLLIGTAYCTDCDSSESLEAYTFSPNYSIGVTWVFPHSGMQFQDRDAAYRVIRAGGRLTFSDDGIVLDGIEREPLRPPNKVPDKGAADRPRNGAVFDVPANIVPGIVFRTAEKAPLTIRTSAGEQDYFVKVEDWVTGNIYKNVYIREGETVNLYVASGMYAVKYAVGREWFGPHELFGVNTAYYRTDKLFHFKIKDGARRGFRLELILQSEGNLSTKQVDKETW